MTDVEKAIRDSQTGRIVGWLRENGEARLEDGYIDHADEIADAIEREFRNWEDELEQAYREIERDQETRRSLITLDAIREAQADIARRQKRIDDFMEGRHVGLINDEDPPLSGPPSA